jgi:hypothetical protein
VPPDSVVSESKSRGRDGVVLIMHMYSCPSISQTRLIHTCRYSVLMDCMPAVDVYSNKRSLGRSHMQKRAAPNTIDANNAKYTLFP